MLAYRSEVHGFMLVCMQLRDYEDGTLVREEPIPEEQLEAVLGKRAAPVKRRQRRARAKVSPSLHVYCHAPGCRAGVPEAPAGSMCAFIASDTRLHQTRDRRTRVHCC
jgi:hypothetical protein